jgi:hypothetical protein
MIREQQSWQVSSYPNQADQQEEYGQEFFVASQQRQ